MRFVLIISLRSSNVHVRLHLEIEAPKKSANAINFQTHPMNTTSLMVGRDDESIRKLRDLLHLSETASDEQILNIVKESNNIQVMLKLRKSRWNKV